MVTLMFVMGFVIMIQNGINNNRGDKEAENLVPMMVLFDVNTNTNTFVLNSLPFYSFFILVPNQMVFV